MFLYNTTSGPGPASPAWSRRGRCCSSTATRTRIFPMDANERIINRLERLYSLYGAGDRVDAVVSVGGHAYRQDIRQAAYRFINTHLKGDARPVDRQRGRHRQRRGQPRPVPDSAREAAGLSHRRRPARRPAQHDDRRDVRPARRRLLKFRRASSLSGKRGFSSSFAAPAFGISPKEFPQPRSSRTWATTPSGSRRRSTFSSNCAIPRVNLNQESCSSFSGQKTPAKRPTGSRNLIRRTKPSSSASPAASAPRAGPAERPQLRRAFPRPSRPHGGHRPRLDIIAAAKYLAQNASGGDSLPPIHVAGKGASGILAAYAAVLDESIGSVTLLAPPASLMDKDSPQFLSACGPATFPTY